MIPTVVVRMDQLPLLPSEKVNRKALPAPDFTSDAVKPPVKAPAKAAGAPKAAISPAATAASSSTSSSSSVTEARPSSSSSEARADPILLYVSEVWADVLGVSMDSIQPLSDFFALGGNSLLCGKMNSRIRTGLNVPGLSGMLIYMNTTLAEFAQAVAVAGAVPAHSQTRQGSMTVTTMSSSCGQGSSDSLEIEEEPDSPRSSDLTDLQQFISEAWAEALGIEPGTLAPDDDFFARGGNSLLCGKMNSSIRSGLSIPSMSGMLIYQHPTLGAFTEAVEASGATLPAAYRSSSSGSSPVSRSNSDTGINGPILDEDALLDFIAAAWAETLGADRSSMTADADFFALGGNSLLCGKMNSRLRVGLNLPGLSGMLIYQNTTLEGFTNAVAQAGPSFPCGTSTCNSSWTRPGRPSADGISMSGSSFRGSSGPSTASRSSSAFSGFSGFSGFSSSSSPSINSSFSSQAGGIASSYANAAAQAAAAAFMQEHPPAAAAAAAGGADWTIGSNSYEQSLAAASKAAYAAANAAFSTVMSTLGLEAASFDAGSSSSSHGGKKSLSSKGSGIFGKHFRSGAGAAGPAAIPVFDARMQSMPSVPSFSLPSGGGKGSVKPTLVDGKLPGEEGSSPVAPADQVKTSAALCTIIQMIMISLIAGFSNALTILPMLGYM